MPNVLERVFVWAGGAMFVISLAVTAWWYTFRFGITRPFTGWIAIVIDALLLSMFAFHHSAFAREPIKRRLASLIPTSLLRSVYVWIASSLLILTYALWQPVGGTIYRVVGWPGWIFAIVQLTGVLLIARSAGAIDPLELAGIRNSKTTDVELQTGGVYGIVRHPLYFGWMLCVFGAAHMTGDRLTFAVATTTYVVIAIPWEERALEREFGQRYRLYKQAVRWKMLPYLY